ncbi:response regulator [Robbsia sp. Bb-Pol-6]|uniref:Response regulator n=1 Tax=Robbsia betulipollinis TaxID=2981849 RepID=A0ABT3ZMD8_9BURK|nr:response regulator [Robbsia betulipollinis]MCY0387627.1 response regulator [Robbsia betulipollinis]
MSAAACGQATVPAMQRNVAAAQGDDTTAMRVVVIDDHQDAASALALLVELWGYDVRVGYDGYAALELAQGFDPHAMLLDIGLPGFSGYEAARCIRQAEARARSGPALLVAVTGYGSPEDIAQAIRSGFDHHLIKPSNPDVLERFLRNQARRLSVRNHEPAATSFAPTSIGNGQGEVAAEPSGT